MFLTIYRLTLVRSVIKPGFTVDHHKHNSNVIVVRKRVGRIPPVKTNWVLLYLNIVLYIHSHVDSNAYIIIYLHQLGRHRHECRQDDFQFRSGVERQLKSVALVTFLNCCFLLLNLYFFVQIPIYCCFVHYQKSVFSPLLLLL